jgi:aspartyl-tRNA(Asn)/glutamyl-tRNA(Gln) amidotransferase subunit C
MSIPATIKAGGELDVGHVSNLARLALTPQEASQYAKELASILAYIAQLKEVDVSGVEPTAHAFPVFNVWADDVPQPGLPVEIALRNAPAQRDHMIVVPKVVE